MLKLIALSALLTGCLTSTTDTTDPIDDSGDGMTVQLVRPADPSDDVCAKLPDDDSPCASACDPDALLTFIPAGTCVTFACHLTDGSLYRTGGCRAKDAGLPIAPVEAHTEDSAAAAQ